MRGEGVEGGGSATGRGCGCDARWLVFQAGQLEEDDGEGLVLGLYGLVSGPPGRVTLCDRVRPRATARGEGKKLAGLGSGGGRPTYQRPP